MTRKRKEKNLFQRPDGLWSVDVSSKGPNGKIRLIRQSFKTKREAVGYLDLYRSRRAYRKIGLRSPREGQGNTPFEEFAEKFISTYSVMKREKTLASHRAALKSLLRFDYFRGKTLADITPEIMSRWKSERGAAKKVSANRELSFLRLLFKTAVQFGEIDINPAAFEQKFREPETQIRVLSDQEAEALINAAAPHLRPVLIILLITGMRKKEALSLIWSYPDHRTDPENRNSIVELERGLIFIPASLAKNHKDREIPISEPLSDLFSKLPGSSAERKRIFPFNDMKRSFRTAARKAGINHLHVHDLRHTAASRMIETGVDVVTVSQILGHSDLKITLRYCHSSVNSKRAAIEKLSGVYFRGQKTTTFDTPSPLTYSRIDN